MNYEMAYLLGMICGNGSIQRMQSFTTVSIEIPHKKLRTEQEEDVRIYIKASITDFRKILEPLIGADLSFSQQKEYSTISFTKPNTGYLIREILRYIGNATSHEDVKISKEVFNFTTDQRKGFLRGFSDVTGYIRRSNYYFQKYKHRVYLEIPHNWELVADICNLLKSVDVPVQSIDWAHPNMRDGYLKKYNEGFPNFWKKEHQIKIWANEFEPIGFAVLHKKNALEIFVRELTRGFEREGKSAQSVTHKYYWEMEDPPNKERSYHPAVNDTFIPSSIRGKQYISWRHIAHDLGYKEQ